MTKNDKSTLLSICVITYNHGKYIKKAIENILKQKVDFKFEIIIADDYSKDNTRDIIIEFYNKNTGLIKLLFQDKNVGPSKNFNDLLNSASGKYIAYLEGDDYWTDPNKLQKQINILESNNEYSACAHQTQLLINEKLDKLFKLNVPQIINIENLIEGRLFHTASCVFRRSAFENFFKMPKNIYSGDRVLNFCIAIEGPIFFMDEVMCVYRKHNNGQSSNLMPKKILLDLNPIKQLKKIYPSFPVLRYKSYVYATAGLIKNINILTKFYLLSISFILSFSIFPKNLKIILNYFSKKYE
jgi:glycosyltransferase involved in cell wall biosynthesis